MGTLLGILGAVLIGKFAIGAVVAGLTVPAWIDLGGGVVSLVQLDAKIIKYIQTHPHQMKGVRVVSVGYELPPGTRLCFQGAPSAQAARFC